MATHSSIIAWRIAQTEEPVHSSGSQTVGPDWATEPIHSSEHLYFLFLLSVKDQ